MNNLEIITKENPIFGEVRFTIIDDKFNALKVEVSKESMNRYECIENLKTYLEVYYHILIFSNNARKTIPEVAIICRNLGFEKAMAFDGGSSTSLDYEDIHIISTQYTGDTGRKLKSFMIVNK